MRETIKKVILFSVITILCLSAFGCGKTYNPDGPTVKPESDLDVSGTVKFTYSFGNISQQKSGDDYIAAFQKKYPNVTVVKDYNPGNIAARIASGEIGDVFPMCDTDVYNYAVTQRSLMSLNQYIEPLGLDMSNIYTGVYALGMIEGEMYMVCKEYDHVVLTYNRTALKEAGLADPEDGWTWDQFKDYATKLTKSSPNDPNVLTQCGGVLNYGWDPVYVAFFEGWGGTWYDTETKKINLTSDDVRQGIDELLSFAKTGAIKPECCENMDAYANLTDANYVFTANTYAQLESVGKMFDGIDYEWDIVSFPKLPVHKVGTGSMGIGVYKYTQNPNAAAALALFMYTDEGQMAFHKNEGGSVPVTRSLCDADFWRYPEPKANGKDWSGKNFDAYVSFPEADTVGRVICKLPAAVASAVTGYWGRVLGEFWSTGSYMNALTTMEKASNDVWQRILRNQDNG